MHSCALAALVLALSSLVNPAAAAAWYNRQGFVLFDERCIAQSDQQRTQAWQVAWGLTQLNISQAEGNSETAWARVSAPMTNRQTVVCQMCIYLPAGQD
jgi:hypothetical protein